MKRVVLFLLAVVLIALLPACNGQSGEAGETTTPVLSSGDITTGTPEENETTEQPAQTTAVVPEEAVTLEIKWSQGYIGSSSHATYTNKINASGSYYSMSDVIHIERAGTKIIFKDDNSDSNGDTSYASGSAYVISSWMKSGNNWVIDLDSPNYAGTGSGNSDIASASGGAVTYTYITSKDNEYIRLCYRSGQTASFTPSKRPVVTSQYTGETGTAVKSDVSAKEVAEYIAAQKASAEFTQLKGLTINIIGDSYFAGNGLNKDYVWPALLAAKYDMTLTNYGANGSTISDYVLTNNPMVRRYISMKNNNPDIVIIEGGKNDYNQSVPIGNLTDTVSTTFMGAVNVLIDGMRVKYPNAVIICVTPWNVAGSNSIGNTVQNYADALMKVCEAKNVVCFNATDTTACGVDMQSATFRAQYCMSANDVSHLNLEGHKRVLIYFEKFIAATYKAAKS